MLVNPWIGHRPLSFQFTANRTFRQLHSKDPSQCLCFQIPLPRPLLCSGCWIQTLRAACWDIGHAFAGPVKLLPRQIISVSQMRGEWRYKVDFKVVVKVPHTGPVNLSLFYSCLRRSCLISTLSVLALHLRIHE